MRSFVTKTAAALETTLPRGIDVLLILLLLRNLAPEDVGLLETAQTIVAPVMLFFLMPEQILFRELSGWRDAHPEAHLPRIRSLRQFCWLKGIAGALLAVAFSFRRGSLDPTVLSVFLWAFSRSLAPQVIGVDREYLRVSGRVGSVFLLALGQRLLFLAGVVIAITAFPGRILAILAATGVFSNAVSAAAGYRFARRIDAGLPSRAGAPAMGVRAIFREAVTSFSLWSHVENVLGNTVESLDVLTLGVLGFPRRAIGIYGSAVRVANVAIALPMAVNTWVAMRIGQSPMGSELRRDWRAVLRPSALLFAISVAQTAILLAAAQVVAELIGTTRWTPGEKAMFANYLTALSLGCALYCATGALTIWLKLCCDVRALFFRVFAPWLVFTSAIYLFYGRAGNIMGIAWSNIASYAFYAAAALLYLRSTQALQARVQEG